MRDNRPFCEEEDQIIRDLYQNQNIKKWSMIARTLTEDYKYPRNAKQCRDRYQQHLDPMMLSQWTPEQQQKLYRFHDQIGNKWAVIAQKFPGRTDNCVKNHFYSKLRKSLRHLNKVIKQQFKKQFKELKIGAIYKIIQALEDRFNENTMIDQEAFNKCIRLKKELLEYSNKQNEQQEEDYEKEKQLIREIVDFSRNYKRKTKKQRRNSLNGAQLFKSSTIEKRIKYSSDQQSSESEYSLVHSHSHNEGLSDAESEKSEMDLVVIEEDIRESMYSKNEPGLRGTQKVQMEEDGVRISEGVRGSQRIRNSEGIGNSDGGFKNLEGIRCSLKVSYKSNHLQSVEEILRQKNALELGNFIYSKKQASICSVSLHSDSQKPDMFDDNIRISEGLRYVEEMEEESPQENIFRSHR